MGFVETERRGQVMVVRMNRPERLNALGQELRSGLAAAWREFRDADDLEVAVFSVHARFHPASTSSPTSRSRRASTPFSTSERSRPSASSWDGAWEATRRSSCCILLGTSGRPRESAIC